MRLIDADALDAQIYNDIPIKVFGSVARMANMRELVSKQPTVDAAPVKHGRWKDVGSLSCRCSECGCKNDRETMFCPNCGAKMDFLYDLRSQNGFGGMIHG